MESQNQHEQSKPQLRHEPEHKGPIWKHPYLVYVLLNVVLFAIVLIAGYIAFQNDMIPNRGFQR